MSRLVKILALCTVAVAVAVVTAACGTQKIDVPKSDSQLYHGAVLFSQRCAGCHTLSYAATNGSAPNVRTAQANSGPNFNQRCERPIDRVLYAIENGGFSGAIMPQNVVVGQDAIDVAKFVATYAGREAPAQVGIINCDKQPLGTLPPGSGQIVASSGS
jgi:mono/diheme cytochrome c family protein